MLETINGICDNMSIDLRFVLASNFLLMFIFKGVKVSTKAKKWISIGIMCGMAAFCWLFLGADGEKLFWSIPTASIAYDYIIKPLYKRWYTSVKAEISQEANDDIDKLDSVG